MYGHLDCPDTASRWLYITLFILTFLNRCISVKFSLINTKLTDFVNLGVLFLTTLYTVWGSIVAYPVIYRLIPSPFRFEIRQLKKIKFVLAESNCSILCRLSSKYMYLLLLWVCAMLTFVCPNIQQNLKSIPPEQNNRYKNNFSYSIVEVNQHTLTEINNQRMQTTTYRTCLSPLKKQEELWRESYLIVIIFVGSFLGTI